MNTTLPSLASRANTLLTGRFDRYATEVRILLAKVEQRGWVKESAAVRAELARLDEGRSLPGDFSTFRDLARLQAGLRRDVAIIRSAASAKFSPKQDASLEPRPFRIALSLSSSSC